MSKYNGRCLFIFCVNYYLTLLWEFILIRLTYRIKLMKTVYNGITNLQLQLLDKLTDNFTKDTFLIFAKPCLFCLLSFYAVMVMQSHISINIEVLFSSLCLNVILAISVGIGYIKNEIRNFESASEPVEYLFVLRA